MINLVAAMIVRDEERNLPRCLTSIMRVVDDVILLDTGSTDATVEIAERFGCNVHKTTWLNSFSAARNEAFSLVPDNADWILVIDADEEFCEVNRGEFRGMLEKVDGWVHALAVTVVNQDHNGKVSSTAQGLRFFRNNKGVRYENDVHNRAIVPYGQAGATDLKIYHYGYDLPAAEMKRKTDRILNMLWKKAQENPLDPSVHYYLANTFLTTNEYIKAIYHADIALSLHEKQKKNEASFCSIPVTGTNNPDYISGLYFVIARSYVEIGAWAHAEGWIDHSLIELPNDIDLNYLSALVGKVRGDKARCTKGAERYLSALHEYRERPDLIGGRNVLFTDKVFEERATAWLNT